MKSKLLLFFAFMAGMGSIRAAVVPSKTTASGSWTNVNNWVGGVLPGPGDDVEINGSLIINLADLKVANLVIKGTLVFHSTSGDSLTVKNLTVDPGGVFNAYGASTGKSVIVKGNFINNGTVEFSYGASTAISANWSTLTMAQATAETFISGSGTFSVFRQLIIDNSNGVTLNAPLSVSGSLYLKNGLFRNGTKLTLDRSALGASTTLPTKFSILRSQSSSLAEAPALGSNNLTMVTYKSNGNLPPFVITEGYEIPASRDIYTLVLDNGGGLNINNDLILRSNAVALDLQNGILTLAAGKTISIISVLVGGIVTEGTATSYVKGGAISLNASGTKVNRILPLGSDGFNRAVTLTGLTGTGTVRYSLVAGQGGTSALGILVANTRVLQASPVGAATQTFEKMSMKFNADDKIYGTDPDKIASSATTNGQYLPLGVGINTSSVINSLSASYAANGFYQLAREGIRPYSSMPNTPLSEIIGVYHGSGKYHFFPQQDFMSEGVDAIQGMGTKVIKLWLGAASRIAYPTYWKNNWVTANFSSLTNLASTAYFRNAFERPGIKTYILTAYEFTNGGNRTNFADGIDSSERSNLYNEIYNLAAHLYTEYQGTGKTFILGSWEGDGMLPYSYMRPYVAPPAATIRTTLQGFIDWLNIRQDAITAARNDAMNTGKTGVLVVGAAECNAVPRAGYSYQFPIMVDSVIPYTHMDLYSLSNWKTNRPSTVDSFNAVLGYVKLKAPASKMYGEDNIYLGEIGTYETTNDEIVGDAIDLPNYNERTDRISREVIQRNIEQALKFGIRYISHWEIYDNGFRNPIPPPRLPDSVNARPDQLVGVGIIRPDGSKSGIFKYYQSIMAKTFEDYVNVYEAEAQITSTSSGTTHSDIELDSSASGKYISKLTASAIGDTIKYALRVTQTGLRNIRVKVRTGPSYGKFKLSIGNTNFAKIVDCYDTINSFRVVDIDTIRIYFSSVYSFKFTVAGKSGSRYDLGIDAIEITAPNSSSRLMTPDSSRSVPPAFQNAVTGFHKNELFVYPNPAQDYITARLETAAAHITIINMQGQMMNLPLIDKVNNKTIRIYIGKYPAGVYTLISDDRKTPKKYAQFIISR